MFTDTHCHLASYKYEASEVGEIVARSVEAGITRIITLATGMDDIAETLALAETFPEVYCGIGIHPCDVTEAPDDFATFLREKLAHPRVSALGETGLDYYHPAPEGWEEETYHARQRDFLDQQFQLAQEMGLNIVLHTRDRSGLASFEDCLAIYEKYAETVRAVFHCFPGTVEQAERVIGMGGIVSFTGNVTFKNARQVQETVSALPLGSFMLETDAPYLAPVPHRGQRNEPAFVKEVVNYICTLKQISPAELSEATENATESFFKF